MNPSAADFRGSREIISEDDERDRERISKLAISKATYAVRTTLI
jgi:hypothetical protein